MRKGLNIWEAIDMADPNGQAIEALIQAEREFFRESWWSNKRVEWLSRKDVDEINRMAFKDDDGYWRICDSNGTWYKKWNCYDDLLRDYPDIE